MSRLSLLFPKIRAGVGAALGRFPWMLLCGLAGTVSAIVALQNERDDNISGQCLRVVMTVALGMPLFFSLRMLRERSVSLFRWPVEIVGLPLLAAFYFTLPQRPSDGPEIIAIRWALLLAALHFFAAVSPFVRGTEKIGFWQYNRRLFLRFFLATLYSAVLTGGLEIAMFSADKLFELRLENSYLDLFFIMAGCFHPAFFLAGVPRDFTALDAEIEPPRGLKAFTQFALAPLVAVYTAILYAYAVKIVLARTWPHGWVALPVLILSGVGILAALLLHPLRTRPEEKWAGWFSRYFPLALAPLSVLLLLSVRERIASYGVTEERYLGIVLGCWILAWALVFIVKKTAGIRWIPASLAAICLAAAFGPLSAGALSKSSQLRRLQGMLASHGLWVGGHLQAPVAAQKLPPKEYDELESTIGYLVRIHGGESLRGLFGTLLKQTDWKKLIGWRASEDILVKLKLASSANTDDRPVTDSPPPSASSLYQFDESIGTSLEGFRRAWYVGYVGDSHKFDDITISIDNGVLNASVADEKLPRPVPVDAIFDSLPASGATLPADRLTVDWTQNGRTLRIVFTTLNLTRKSGGKVQIGYSNFLLLEK